MYGKSPVEFPKRVVCLTAETTEKGGMMMVRTLTVSTPKK